VVAYLACKEIEVDEYGREVREEVEVPWGPTLPPGIAQTLLIVAEDAEPNNSEGARAFARSLAAIPLGRLDDEVDAVSSASEP
jgi:hypothetical protein